MSEAPPEIRIVCEGPTDLVVLTAILDRYLGDFEPILIQPSGSLYGGDAGPHGGGWKGVRSWCQEVAAAGGLEALQALTPETRLLIIHVDADIAADGEIDLDHPCPPPLTTVEHLARRILDWLGLDTLPDRVALCIPSKATEAWILPALFPDNPDATPCPDTATGDTTPEAPCVECLPKPERSLLDRRPRLVRFKKNKLKKRRREYEAQQPLLTERWPDIVEHCHSARWFDRQLEAKLETPLPK